MNKYCFSGNVSKIFITGAPLSGKTTVATLLSSRIESAVLLPMDIIRLFAQQIEELKIKNQRNEFVYLGACDSYQLIGDGSYAPEKLLAGYRQYSKAVCEPLKRLLPKIDSQGCGNIIFEGVQLMPELIGDKFDSNSVLIFVKNDRKGFEQNFLSMYGDDEEMKKRYEIEKLLLIQRELKKQLHVLGRNQVLVINNNEQPFGMVLEIIEFLLKNKLIKE